MKYRTSGYLKGLWTRLDNASNKLPPEILKQRQIENGKKRFDHLHKPEVKIRAKVHLKKSLESENHAKVMIERRARFAATRLRRREERIAWRNIRKFFNHWARKDKIRNKHLPQKLALWLLTRKQIGKKRPEFSGKNNPMYVHGQSRFKYPHYKVKRQTVYWHIKIACEREGFHRLPPQCHVHHIDMDRNNYQPENLLILPAEVHNKLHAVLQSKKWRANLLE